jgi:KUP system potassium uptake protein
MTSNAIGTPPVLLHHFKHNKVLHARVILLTVRTEAVPEVPRRERVAVEDLGQGFWRVTAHIGFMETPDVPAILRLCERRGLSVPMNETSYYLGRETLLRTGQSSMARWRKSLFAFLIRNAQPATAFFRLPPNRVVELGAQVEI